MRPKSQDFRKCRLPSVEPFSAGTNCFEHSIAARCAWREGRKLRLATLHEEQKKSGTMSNDFGPEPSAIWWFDRNRCRGGWDICHTVACVRVLQEKSLLVRRDHCYSQLSL